MYLQEIGNHTEDDELNATYGWIEERHQVIQGSMFSLWCYSTDASLLDSSWKNLSDEELIDAIMNKAASIPGSADISSRWPVQGKQAKDILNGKCTESELETYIRTGQVPSGCDW